MDRTKELNVLGFAAARNANSVVISLGPNKKKKTNNNPGCCTVTCGQSSGFGRGLMTGALHWGGSAMLGYTEEPSYGWD